MSGIAGILQFSPTGAQRDTLVPMLQLLRHRGPDDAGFYTDRHAGLAHAHLYLCDGDGGKQPLHDAEHGVCAMLDGVPGGAPGTLAERLGHIMRAHARGESDLGAYDQSATSICLWDYRRKRLFLASDPSGACPLFYAILPSCLMFASEIKALMAISGIERRLDAEALALVMGARPLPPDRTIFSGVHRLPAGYVLLADAPGFDPRIMCRPNGAETRPAPPGPSLWQGLCRALAWVAPETRLAIIGANDPRSALLQAVMQDVTGGPPRVIASGRHLPIAASALPRAVWHAERPLVDVAALQMLGLAEHAAREGLTVLISASGGPGDGSLAPPRAPSLTHVLRLLHPALRETLGRTLAPAQAAPRVGDEPDLLARAAMAASVLVHFPYRDPLVRSLAGHGPMPAGTAPITPRGAERVGPPPIWCDPSGRPLSYVDEMLDPDRLRARGYFDAEEVRRLMTRFRTEGSLDRFEHSMLLGVLSTMLLDDLFIRSPVTAGREEWKGWARAT